jgi:hypothetical protein
MTAAVPSGHASEDATGLIYMRGRYYSPLWQAIGNYHSHTFPYPEGWGFSGEDMDRRVLGAPLSNYFYSAIITPNRYSSTLIGWYPPNVADDETVSAYEMEINGDGCQ